MTELSGWFILLFLCLTPPLTSALCSMELFSPHGGYMCRAEFNNLIDADKSVFSSPPCYIHVLPVSTMAKVPHEKAYASSENFYTLG